MPFRTCTHRWDSLSRPDPCIRPPPHRRRNKSEHRPTIREARKWLGGEKKSEGPPAASAPHHSNENRNADVEPCLACWHVGHRASLGPLNNDPRTTAHPSAFALSRAASPFAPTDASTDKVEGFFKKDTGFCVARSAPSSLESMRQAPSPIHTTASCTASMEFHRSTRTDRSISRQRVPPMILIEEIVPRRRRLSEKKDKRY